jgi:Domain of unknown function (DUF4136)
LSRVIARLTMAAMRRPILVTALVLLGACAAGPKIRADHDPAANFAAYHTYNFEPQLGTDRAGYTTLITNHFKNAVNREMQSRGYALADKPDLLINFFTSLHERTDVQSAPELSMGIGFSRRSFGLYSEWPLYDRSVASSTYKVGIANIDVVDAARKQLVWQGVAEGRVTDGMLEDPGPAISDAVTRIFKRYPARAGSAVP